MVQTTHEIELGRSSVVKCYRRWDAGEVEREWCALRLLDRRAPGLAPRPLRRTDRDDRPCITMTRLPGVPLGDRPLLAPQLAALTRAMAELHDAVPVREASAVPARALGPPAMVNRVRDWMDTPGLPVPRRVRPAVRRAAAWLAGEDPASLAVGAAGAPQVFTNADGNLGNYLWDGERCRVVDFEDAGMSDAAYEVADFVEHLSTWRGGRVDADAFVRTVGIGSDGADRVQAARRLFATFWLLMLLPGGPAARRNPPEALEQQADRLLALLRAAANPR